MCVLSKQKILKMVDKGNIKINPFDPDMVDAASVDFTLNSKIRTFRNQKGIHDLKEDIDVKGIGKLIEIDEKGYTLKPHEMILGMTNESIELPEDICGRFEGRSSLARLGLMVHVTSGLIHPGSKGNQVLEMINMGNIPIKIYPGLRICQIVFETMKGKAKGNSKFSMYQDSP